MARSSEAPAPRRRSGGGGGGWFVLALIVIAAGATFIFAGDKVRGMLGIASKPSNEGSEPTAPEGAQATVVPKTPPDSTQTGEVATKAAEVQKPIVVKPVVQLPVAPLFKDQAKADQLLGEAEKAYKSFKWDSARNLADGIARLDAKPATLARARDVSGGSNEIANLFKHLGDDRDELTRNWDTSPSLVQIGEGGNAMLAVPVTGDGKDPVPVEQDPVGYIRSAIKAGPVKMLVKGKKDFILTQLDSITDVALVDQAQIHSEKQVDFDQKLAALRNSTASRDALAWYEAAKFAYRNRLDDLVTSMLDQALDLDPMLVKSVREDKAGRLYSSMVFHLKNNNKKQADAYMGIIKRKYADTDQGKQASLYYDGKTADLVAMAMDEDRKRKEADEARRTARLEKAKQSGDQSRVKAIEEEKPVVEETDSSPSLPSNPDEAAAQQAFDSGMKIYSKAVDMPATPARNTAYKQAGEAFKQCVAIYKKLIEKTPNDSLAAKMVEANKLRFGCEKYQTVW